MLSYAGITVEGPLWTIPSQGGKPQRVGEAICNYARWSPDNTKIACAHSTTILVMDADGNNSRILGAFAAPVRMVVWTPNGKRLDLFWNMLQHTLLHNGRPVRTRTVMNPRHVVWIWVRTAAQIGVGRLMKKSSFIRKLMVPGSRTLEYKPIIPLIALSYRSISAPWEWQYPGGVRILYSC